MKTIHFYSSKESYGQFFNFAPYSIQVGDTVWPTVEHYYQAQKFPGAAEQELIRLAETPKAAATLERGLAHLYRADWEKLKERLMLKGYGPSFLNAACSAPNCLPPVMRSSSSTLPRTIFGATVAMAGVPTGLASCLWPCAKNWHVQVAHMTETIRPDRRS